MNVLAQSSSTSFRWFRKFAPMSMTVFLSFGGVTMWTTTKRWLVAFSYTQYSYKTATVFIWCTFPIFQNEKLSWQSVHAPTASDKIHISTFLPGHTRQHTVATRWSEGVEERKVSICWGPPPNPLIFMCNLCQNIPITWYRKLLSYELLPHTSSAIADTHIADCCYTVVLDIQFKYRMYHNSGGKSTLYENAKR